MLGQYIVAIPNGVPERDKEIRIIERKDYSPIEYEPIDSSNDRMETEKIMKYIIEVGVDEYLAGFQKKA